MRLLNRLAFIAGLLIPVAAFAAADFPTSPTTGQTYSYSGRTWQYDGTAWNIAATGAGPGINQQEFTVDGTYTPSPGMVYAKVICTGAGGGGGGSDSDGSGAGAGGGGEAGGTAIKWYTASEIGASAAVDIGALGAGGSATNGAEGTDGADTTFDPAGSGATITGAGGDGGDGSGANTDDSVRTGPGANEGTATNGDLNIVGGWGGSGITGLEGTTQAPFAHSGYGGGSFWGGGAASVTLEVAFDIAGYAGGPYGAGGSGAVSVDSATGAAGGNGAAGICVAEEYIAGGWTPANTPPGLIYGLTLSNNGSDANNDIDIAVGRAADSTHSTVMVNTTSGLTKRQDAAWTVGDGGGGLDGTESVAGTPDTTTWSHVYLISNGSTVDAIFSENASAPTLPSGYIYYRRIGSVRRGVNLNTFTQVGDTFLKGTVNTLQNDTSDVAWALLNIDACAPLGIVTQPILSASVNVTSARTYIQVGHAADTGATNPIYMADAAVAGLFSGATTSYSVYTNTSQQIHYKFEETTTGEGFLYCNGWIDTRGRLN